MNAKGPVLHELRVALTAEDYDRTLAFYRDVLGLLLVETWEEAGGRGAVLDAGRATLEVLSASHADLVDRIEVGEPVGARVRLALEVDDSAETAEKLVAAGAELVGGPVVTPWAHRNVRLRDPDGMQLTLFTVLDSAET
jgi:lactoylglutathione lyase